MASMTRGFWATALACVALAAGVTCQASASPAGPVVLANRGQVERSVSFYGTFPRGAVYFTDRGPVIELREVVPLAPERALPASPTRSRERRAPEALRRFAVGLRFVGASPRMRVEPVGDPVGPRRHFIGSIATTGSLEVPAYEGVAYRGVWPGTDVVYTIDEQGLSYRIVSRSGAPLPPTRFDYEGATAIETEEELVRVVTPLGTIVDRRQSDRNPGGRVEWPSANAPRGIPAEKLAVAPPSAISAALASEQPTWGAFVGGNRDDAVYAVAVDDQLHTFVVGATRSTDFPVTLGAVDTTYGGSFDAFVAAISADGADLLWSTYIGGTGDDRAWAVALDSLGRPVVAGVTSGEGFPTTPGAYDETPNGLYDAFVLALSADGSTLAWSTLYGGSDVEWDVSGLAIDALGRPVLAGSTRSDDLPLGPSPYDSTLDGILDGFVVRFAADASALDYATYLGGSADDVVEDVTTTAAASAVITGRSTSTDFPVTPGALQPAAHPGSQDGFVAALSSDGGSLLFGTYLGGSDDDEPYAVALDETERVVVTGKTASTDFPTTPGAYSPTPVGSDDAFVAKLAADGTALVWSSYFGGTSTDRALALTPDGPRGWVFAGWTCSEDLPLTPNAFASEFAGPCDAFVSRLDDDGAALAYSSYLGGWRDDSAFGVAVDADQRIVVGGLTWSTDFPVTAGSFDPSHNSPDTWEDGFAMAIATSATCTSITLGVEGPELTMTKASDGACPSAPVLATAIDLVEGRIDSLSSTDLGDVSALVCDGVGAVETTVSLPQPDHGLFQLARSSAGGSYTDAGGAGLSGSRQPATGDCP